MLTIFIVLQIKPGLSAYAQDPQQAAKSLVSLLDKAESVVPMEFRSMTPVRVGVRIVFIYNFFIHMNYMYPNEMMLMQATAGLRALEGDASDRILQAVNIAW